MNFAPHLFFELLGILGVLAIPQGQGRGGRGRSGGEVVTEFFFGRSFVVVGQVAQKEEGEHVVAKVVGVHRTPQVVGNSPKGVTEFFLIFGGHRLPFGFDVLIGAERSVIP